VIDNYSPSQQEPRGPCVKCGHDGQYLDRGGACWALREKEDDRIQVHCGCQCVFPRATEGLTVEAALQELRELFPDWPSKIEITTDGIFRVWFWPSKLASVESMKFGHSLADCMDQVRAWAKSRAEREGEQQ